ncbi:MAG: hypothetical protein PHF20_09720 [Halothiobacillaceae bacterium]|nr:hypothetical protein [Halothiobacillaceae bacterium]
MAKVGVPIRMMKKGLREALWSCKEMLALAWVGEAPFTLKKPLTSDAWLGVT